MPEVKFDYRRVKPRKTLLQFVEEHADPEVLNHIGDNPRAWVEELSLINQVLTGYPLVGGTGIDQPPIDEPEFRSLGNGAFYYGGRHDRLRGLWLKKHIGKELEEITGSQFEWTHYRMNEMASLRINHEFADISFEEFLPENFEQRAKPVQKPKGEPKRPILTFPVIRGDQEIVVFAKGADVSLSYFYEKAKPTYRLTHISNVFKTTSQREMEVALELEDLGVRVPKIIGYYQSSVEEFLFLQEVEGRQPDEFLPTHREEIIRQDAEILASLCIAGYRKQRFADFDDKVFDGKDLYLIDTDEVRDLYSTLSPNFREILLNPQDSGQLRRFRALQRRVFIGAMRDTLFNYISSLTPTDDDRENYIRTFYQRMGWKDPSQRQMKNLTSFPDNYVPHDDWMAMMSEE